MFNYYDATAAEAILGIGRFIERKRNEKRQQRVNQEVKNRKAKK